MASASVVNNLKLFKLLIVFSYNLIFSEINGQTLPAPSVMGEIRCGAGRFTLTASSELDGSPGLLYNWYESDGSAIDSYENGTFITESIIETTTYQVSISLNGEESDRMTVSAIVENTVEITQAPRIGLCEADATLNATSTFSSTELATATFQWQRFAIINEDGIFTNLSTGDGGGNDNITTDETGFYRVVVETALGCQAISRVMEVTTDTLIAAQIVSDPVYCYDGTSTFTMSSEYTRDIASYTWEFSGDNINFTEIGTAADLTLQPSDITFPVMANMVNVFVRLTVTEQSCSLNSDIFTLQVTQIPEVEISRLSSTANFFYCPTDAEAFRTLDATQLSSFPNVSLSWQRVQTIDELSQVSVNLLVDAGNANEFFETVGTGAQFILEADDWGWYRSVITDDDSGCTGVSNVIFVNSAISEIRNNAPALCAVGGSVILNSFSETNDAYQWSFSNVQTGPFSDIAGATDTSLDLQLPTTTGEGFYVLSTTNNGCSSSSSPTFVTEDALLSGAVSSERDYICEGGNSLINSVLDENGVSLDWQYASDGVNFGILNDDSIAYFADAAGTYRLEVTNGTCVATTNSLSFRQEASPGKAVSYSPPTSDFCKPIKVELNDQSDSYTYQWYFSGDRINRQIIDGASDVSLLVADRGYYFADITNSFDCTSVSDTTFQRGNIDASIQGFDGSASICSEGGQVLLQVENDVSYSYTWQYRPGQSESFSIVQGSTDQPSYIARNEGFYQAIISNGDCLVPSQELQVQIDLNIIPGFNATIVGDTVACGIDQIELASSYRASEASYQWFYSSNGSDYTYVGEDNDTLRFVPQSISLTLTDDQNDFYARLNVTEGTCSALSDSLPFSMFRKPSLEISRLLDNSSGNFSYCPTQDTLAKTIFAQQRDTDYPLSYQWEVMNENGSYVGLENIDNNIFIILNEIGFVRAVGSIKAFETCQGESNTIFLDRPPSEFVEQRLAICENNARGTLKINETASGISIAGSDYEWFYSEDGNDFMQIEGQSSDTLTINPPNTFFADGFYRFRATRDECVLQSNSAEVRVQDLPEVEISTSDEFCRNAFGGSISVRIDGDSLYQYALAKGLYQSNPEFLGLNTGDYQVFVRDSLGCVLDTAVSLSFEIEFETELNADTFRVQKGIPFEVSATQANTHAWRPEELFLDGTGADVIAYLPTGYEGDTAQLFLITESVEGCIDRDTATVIVELISEENFNLEEVVFSKVISPNGDLINDYFEIIGVPEEVESTLYIIDTWGKTIHNVSNYDHENELQAEALIRQLENSGTYFYVFRSNLFNTKDVFQVIH